MVGALAVGAVPVAVELAQRGLRVARSTIYRVQSAIT